MFTGIIEALGTVTAIETNGSNRVFWLNSPLSDELKIDQSVSHNGVCLTVDDRRPRLHRVTAIAETLQKTNLGAWKTGDQVNLERCLLMNGRLDGHLVQGHVDATGTVLSREDQDGSWLFSFSFDRSFAALMIEKGSICINGTSLTAFDVKTGSFSVAIIPYTFTHTNFSALQPGDQVNLEFDMIGKYINRIQSLRG